MEGVDGAQGWRYRNPEVIRNWLAADTKYGQYALEPLQDKAAIFHGPHQPLTIEQVEIDEPQDHEVLVRTAARQD